MITKKCNHKKLEGEDFWYVSDKWLSKMYKLGYRQKYCKKCKRWAIWSKRIELECGTLL